MTSGGEVALQLQQEGSRRKGAVLLLLGLLVLRAAGSGGWLQPREERMMRRLKGGAAEVMRSAAEAHLESPVALLQSSTHRTRASDGLEEIRRRRAGGQEGRRCRDRSKAGLRRRWAEGGPATSCADEV